MASARGCPCIILNLTIYPKSLFQLIASSRPSSFLDDVSYHLNGSIPTWLSPQPLNLMVKPRCPWLVLLYSRTTGKSETVGSSLSLGHDTRGPTKVQTPHSVQAHLGHLGSQATLRDPSNNQCSHIQHSPFCLPCHGHIACIHERLGVTLLP
jgi:hypothetical protein